MALARFPLICNFAATRDPMIFYSQPNHRRQRSLPVALSLIGHLAVLIYLTLESNAQPRQNAYQQLIAGHEPKLLWYKFRDKLPDVKPLTAKGDERPPKAEEKLEKQNIISSPEAAPKGRQMVWMPAPEMRLDRDVATPNVLAALPNVAPPAKKQFMPPAPRPAAIKSALEVPPAPELTARALAAPRFDLPKVYRPFVPPSIVRTVPQRTLEPIPEAPAMAAQGAAPVAGLSSDLSHIRRPFTPPATATGSSRTAPSPAEMPAAPQMAAARNTYTGAIVGLDPAETLKIPQGSRPAAFSAGPVVNPNGGVPGSSKEMLSVPDLYVRGGGKDLQPTVVARTTLPKLPTSVMSDDTLRGTSKYMTVKNPGQSSGTAVTNAPDSHFDGRQVYTMAVQMPNITSYVGSWLMWYSERDKHRPLDDGISAPVARHKVDPKYIATAAEERVQGAVRLFCVVDALGHVTNAELVRGVDPRLDSSALDAFRKWEFEPAMRHGEPVAVDLLVEIPFRLAPRAEKE